MTKRFFISRNYRHPYTASSKAKMDAERIAEHNGFENIGLPSRMFTFSLIGSLWTRLSTLLGLLRMPSHGIVFLQHPSSNTHVILKRAKKLNNKVVILIHDINSLRGLTKNNVLDFINQADCVIVHTEKMKNYIQELYPKAHIEILELFDYLDSQLSDYNHTNGLDYTVAFAGNIGKSKFVPSLSNIPVLFKLFGVGGENLPKSQNFQYQGCFPPSVLSQVLNADFGLVWDGISIDTCDGVLGEYLKYICPHKLSMYLSSGIPVIVWRESAMADFVASNNVGITVKSLTDLPEIFSSLSIEDYAEIKKNAIIIGKKVSNGYFLSKILSKY